MVVTLTQIIGVAEGRRRRELRLPKTLDNPELWAEGWYPAFPERGAYGSIGVIPVHMRDGNRLLQTSFAYAGYWAGIATVSDRVFEAAERVHQNHMATTRGLKA